MYDRSSHRGSAACCVAIVLPFHSIAAISTPYRVYSTRASLSFDLGSNPAASVMILKKQSRDSLFQRPASTSRYVTKYMIEVRLRWSVDLLREEALASCGGWWYPETPLILQRLLQEVRSGERLFGQGMHWIDVRKA